MTPEEYEHYVAQSFKEMGYETVVTSFSNDYGVDVFAIKGDEKIAPYRLKNMEIAIEKSIVMSF